MAYIVLPTLAAEPVLVSRTSAPAWAAGRPARARERAADRREAMRGRRAMHGGRIGCSRGSCRRVGLSARRSSSSRRACSTRLVPGFDDTGPIIDGDGSSDGPGQSVRVSIHRPLGLAAPALVVRVGSAPRAHRRRRRRQRRPQTKRAGLDPPTSGSSAAGASLTTPFLIFAADRDAERGVARWPVLIIALRG